MTSEDPNRRSSDARSAGAEPYRSENLDRQLRSLDPVAGDRDRSVEHSEAKSALFEEITMTTPVQSRLGRAFRRGPSGIIGNRPALVVPAVLAVMALIGGGLFVIGSAGAPSAAAAAVLAVERSAEFDSGRIEIQVDIDEIEGDPESAGLEAALDYRFEDDDFRLDSFLPVPTEGADFSEILVDGVSYIRRDSGKWFSAVGEDGREAQPSFDSRGIWGFNNDSADPAAMIDLIELASDFSEVSDEDEKTVYVGTVAAVDLISLGDRLPVGLGLLVGGDDPAADLPEEVNLTIAVVDGVLSEVVVDMDGDSPTGLYFDATVTIAYSGFGESQNIEAPSADELVPATEADIPALPPEVQEANAVLEEVGERRPGLCLDVIDELIVDPASEAGVPDDLEASMAQLAARLEACFIEAGEPAAAAAVKDVVSFTPDLSTED